MALNGFRHVGHDRTLGGVVGVRRHLHIFHGERVANQPRRDPLRLHGDSLRPFQAAGRWPTRFSRGIIADCRH
jgi:hypothetical protein